MKKINHVSRLWHVNSVFYGSLVVLISMYYFDLRHAEIIVAPDTVTYLDFHRSRSSGYQIFLWLTRTVFGTLESVLHAQLILSAAAYAFLGWSIYKVFHAPILASVLVYFLISFPELARYQTYILTESLFITLLCVMMGTLICCLAKPTWWLAAASALACGLAIMVRPAGFSLLPIWPIVLWFIWRRCDGQRIRITSAIIVPIALCLLVDNAVWRAHHGFGTKTSLVNIHLFAKTLMIESEPKPIGLDKGLARFMARSREMTAPARELIHGSPDQRTRAFILTRVEVGTQYRTYTRVFREYEKKLLRRRGGDSLQLRGQIGWAALTSAPVAWMKNALIHYWGLWFGAWGNFTPDSALRYNAYIKDTYVDHVHGPLFSDALLPYTVEPAGRLYRWGLMLGLCASLLSLAFAVSQKMRRGVDATDDRLVAACLAGLMVHGNYLMIGLFGVCQSRYAIAMYPLLAVCCLLSADWALQKGFRILSRSSGVALDPGYTKRQVGYNR